MSVTSRRTKVGRVRLVVFLAILSLLTMIPAAHANPIDDGPIKDVIQKVWDLCSGMDCF